MDSLNITTAELLEALAAATTGEGPDHARTAQEMAREARITLSQVQKALRLLHVQGRLVPHRVTRVGIDGRAARVPAYTILPAKAELRRA